MMAVTGPRPEDRHNVRRRPGAGPESEEDIMAQGISVHLGLNSVDPAHYQGWAGPLNACENDAAGMAQICGAKGFATSCLLTGQATRAAVERAVRSAAATLQAGDSFLISYSGHGGQIPDRNGDEDDALDETWCLFDGEILDDELNQLYATFRAGVRVTVFSDSCHSGTVVRMLIRSGLASPGLALSPLTAATEVRPRIMPPEIMRTTYYANQAFYDGLVAARGPKARVQASLILVSGCQDNQLSMDGPFNGAFTGQLLSTYRNGGYTGTYRELTAAIRARLPLTQSPNYLEDGVIDPAHAGGACFAI